MVNKESIFIVPAFPLEELRDPTGAGDSFAGGMVSFLSKNKNITDAVFRKAVVYGTIIASFTVQDFGTTALDSVSYADIKNRYKKLSQFTSFKNI